MHNVNNVYYYLFININNNIYLRARETFAFFLVVKNVILIF